AVDLVAEQQAGDDLTASLELERHRAAHRGAEAVSAQQVWTLRPHGLHSRDIPHCQLLHRDAVLGLTDRGDRQIDAPRQLEEALHTPSRGADEEQWRRIGIVARM